MRAVWSYWPKPYREHRNRIWLDEKFHLFSWVLSFETARRHYADTVLWTDTEGADLLVGQLGLEFAEVCTGLDAIADADPCWWSLGKLYAYRAQRQPFVHIDSDVYLWQPLPDWLVSAPIFAQNPEHIWHGSSCYEAIWFERALDARPGTWLPEAWTWYRSLPGIQEAPCCGVVGGADPAFFSYYADQGIRILEHPENRIALQSLGNRVGHMILIEQYLLFACMLHEREIKGRRDLSISYLFPSINDAMDQEKAAEKGYTHLLAGAKSDELISQRLETRVARDYPDRYARCIEAVARRRELATALP